MNRSDPFHERDGTGWQFIDMDTGNSSVDYQLSDNTNRRVAYNSKLGRPEDTRYQAKKNQIWANKHY